MHHLHCPLCSASTRRFVHPVLSHTGLTGCRLHLQRGANHHYTTCGHIYQHPSVSRQRHTHTCRHRSRSHPIPACQRTPAIIVNHNYGPTHVTSPQYNPVPEQSLALLSSANASLMLQNNALQSKVSNFQTALLQHKPVPQQLLALPSNVNASPTLENNEPLSKVSNLGTALQKAEQEASSAKSELSELKTSLVKASEEAAKESSEKDFAQKSIAPGFGNFDITVRAKVFVDRK